MQKNRKNTVEVKALSLDWLNIVKTNAGEKAREDFLLNHSITFQYIQFWV